MPNQPPSGGCVLKQKFGVNYVPEIVISRLQAAVC